MLSWQAIYQFALAAVWLLLYALDRSLHLLVFALAWLGLGTLTFLVGGTRIDADEVWPNGQLRRVPWSDVTAAYTTSSSTRRGEVALVRRDRRKPLWIKDPDGVVPGYWEAATSRTAAHYGSYSSPDLPLSSDGAGPPPTGAAGLLDRRPSSPSWSILTPRDDRPAGTSAP